MMYNANRLAAHYAVYNIISFAQLNRPTFDVPLTKNYEMA